MEINTNIYCFAYIFYIDVCKLSFLEIRGVFLRRFFLIIILILCGGCLSMDNSGSKAQEKDEIEEVNAYEQENYVPVQEYAGEGFALRDANPKTGEIAEENREEVVAAVEQFFLNEYKIEIQVHNIVSAVDGVSVFVESVGDPHFYSFAIVPVDIKNREVQTDQVWSQEGQVESAISSGLFAMAFEEEFARLDSFLEGIEEELPVVGERIEMIQNTQGAGYETPYYFITTGFRSILDIYLDKPNITKEELRAFLDKEDYDYTNINGISIRFYMEESNIEPDETIYDHIYAGIEDLEAIPGGHYSVILNDNYIDRRRAIGEKDNTIDKTSPNRIEK